MDLPSRKLLPQQKIYKGKGIGRVKVNYRLRDAIFSRQRYWGEPFPVYYKEGIPCMLDDKDLPLLLPEIDAYLPTEKVSHHWDVPRTGKLPMAIPWN